MDKQELLGRVVITPAINIVTYRITGMIKTGMLAIALMTGAHMSIQMISTGEIPWGLVVGLVMAIGVAVLVHISEKKQLGNFMSMEWIADNSVTVGVDSVGRKLDMNGNVIESNIIDGQGAEVIDESGERVIY